MLTGPTILLRLLDKQNAGSFVHVLRSNPLPNTFTASEQRIHDSLPLHPVELLITSREVGDGEGVGY